MASVINFPQAAILRAAISVLRELQGDGYIDWSPSLEKTADDLDDILSTYIGCEKAPSLREVG